MPLVPEQLADQGKVLPGHGGLARGDVPKVVQAQAAELCVRAGIGSLDLFDRRRVLMDDWARYLAWGIGGPRQVEKRQVLVQPASQEASIGSRGTAVESSHEAAGAGAGWVDNFRLRGSSTCRHMGDTATT